jgi:hypothetical protein
VNLRVLVVAVAAAIMCGSAASAASARRPPKIRLPLLPLQTAQLGPAGASLPIEFDSGPVSNRDAPSQLKKAGRLGGYLLDYGDPYLGGTGVTAIETQVERFRTHAGAKKGLKFWRKQEALLPALFRSIGLPFSGQFFKVPAVGSAHFAFVTSMQIPNADPLYSVDEVARSGSFILHGSLAAGTESTAKHLAPVLLAKLQHRLRQMLGGHLRGKPVKLPPLPEAGPPAGGPDLSSFVVSPADFTGQATVLDQGYDVDPSAVSTYGIDLQPAGPFDEAQQSISWYINDNEATWQGTLFGAIFSGNALTPVDVSAVGDNAKAVIGTGEDASGASVSITLVSMWQGQALDFAIADSTAPIQPSDVQTLAQSMANHLNAGLAALPGYAPTTWTSQRLSRSRSSSMKSTRCQVPSWSSPSRTGTDSPAVPSSMAMQWEWPLPWSMSSGQMFSVRRSQSSCA